MSDCTDRTARGEPFRLFTLPLAGGRELEVSREPAPYPGEWIRLALFRRYGTDRMQEGGFVCERGELVLLALALESHIRIAA